jgi:hypothetical protein
MTAEDQPIPKLEELKSKLDSINKRLIGISSQIMQAGNSTAHKLDFYFLSNINRAIALNKGFDLLIENQNSLTAVSLVRLQLDNVIRLFATKVIENGDDFLEYFFAEKSINNYKVNGQKLTDKFLVTKLNEENPGSLDLYNYLCDYVHFSYKHFNATKENSENENALFRMVVGDFEILAEHQKKIFYENMISMSKTIIKLSIEWITVKIMVFENTETN